MSAITAYEVQSFRNGDWKIEAITDSKDLAVHQAEQVILNPAVRKVRVVQEAFDPESAEQKFRTVFIRDKNAPCKPAARPAATSGQQAAASSPAARPAPERKKKGGNGIIGLTLKFAAIVCAGIAIIIALRHFGAGL